MLGESPSPGLIGALRDLDLHTTSVRSLDEALANHEPSSISLVVVDKDSIGDALETVRRADAELPGALIVVVSSSSPVDEMVRSYAAGADLHVSRKFAGESISRWFWELQDGLRGHSKVLLDDIATVLEPADGEESTASLVVEVLRERAFEPEFEVRRIVGEVVGNAAMGDHASDLARQAHEVVEHRALERFEGREPGGADPTRAEPPEDDVLHWNSRFPGREAILANWPETRGQVDRDTTYTFETALETSARPGATAVIRHAERLVGTDIVFQLKGTGVRFGTVGASDVRHRVVRSDPIPVTPTGTTPFAVECRADAVGPAVIEADLFVSGARIADQRIELLVVADDGAPAPVAEAASGGHRPGPMDPDGVAEVIPVDVELTLHGSPDAILLDVTGRGRGFRMWDLSADAKLGAVAAAVAASRPTLVSLSRRYGEDHPGDGGFSIGDLANEVLVTFAQIGWQLHELLFGLPASDGPTAEIGRAIATVGRDEGREAVLEIEDRIGLPIPWGIVYDARAYAAARRAEGDPADLLPGYPKARADVDLSSFWGYRFANYRTIVQRPDVPSPQVGGPDRRVVVTAVVNPALEPAVVERQTALFPAGHATDDDALVVASLLHDRSSFLEWVEDGRASACDLLYCFCHARTPTEFGAAGFPAAAAWDSESMLGLGAEQDANAAATLKDLRIAWGEPRQRRPVVMLHACGSAQNDAVYGAPFVRYFLKDWRGRALVGTDWAVPTHFADAFSRAVVEELRAGATLLAAMRAATHAAFEADNPYPLMYALYGQPNVHFVQRGQQ
jgi:hypothetical protein